jgi:hypothetical protein
VHLNLIFFYIQYNSISSLCHAHSRNWILFSVSPSRKITLATGPELRLRFAFRPTCVTVLAIPVFINYPVPGDEQCTDHETGVLTGLDFSEVTPCSLAVMYGHLRGVIFLYPPRWRWKFNKNVDECLPDSHSPENNYISTASNFTIHKEKSNKMQDATIYQNYIISYLYEAQHVTDDTPPIIKSLKLHRRPLVFYTLSDKVLCLTTSTNYTSNNLPRMKNQRLPVQF